MWNNFKWSVVKGMFPKEAMEIKIARMALQAQVKRYKNLTIADAVREQMGSRTVDETKANLFASIPKDRVPNFLEEAKTIMDGEVFGHIVKTIVAQQREYIVSEAESLEHVNFGRATLNGVELMEEALASLVVEYEQRHAAGDDFDRHSAV